MPYETVLTVHIALGIATGLVASYAAVALWNHTARAYRATAIGLGFLAALEVLTGTSLSLISPSVTAISVCANILIYLSVVFFFETLLLLRMKAASQPLPIINTISPLASSLLVLLGAVTLGF
jgi:hypothetical protein